MNETSCVAKPLSAYRKECSSDIQLPTVFRQAFLKHTVTCPRQSHSLADTGARVGDVRSSATMGRPRPPTRRKCGCGIAEVGSIFHRASPLAVVGHLSHGSESVGGSPWAVVALGQHDGGRALRCWQEAPTLRVSCSGAAQLVAVRWSRVCERAETSIGCRLPRGHTPLVPLAARQRARNTCGLARCGARGGVPSTLHAFASARHVWQQRSSSGRPRCERWCGYRYRCSSPASQSVTSG